MFKKGQAKQIKKERVDGTPLESIVKKYAVGVTKSGGVAKSYTLLDVMSIMHEAEDAVKLIWKCPNCGNTNRTKMNIARRTCGYIGVNDFNQGRTQEIKERYVHLGGE